MKRLLAGSLSLRLLLLFALSALALVAILVALFFGGLGRQWQRSIAPQLARYALYVERDLGHPPDPERADRLAASLPLSIAIYRGDRLVHATDGRAIDPEALRFRPLPPPRRSRPLPSRPDAKTSSTARTGSAPPPRIAIARGDERERAVLRVERGADTVYFRLQSPRPRRFDHVHGLDLALAAVALVLLASYLAIRRELAPIRHIQQGVRRMSEGDLDHRIGVDGQDDLAELGASVDEMAERIGAMLEAKRQLLLAVSHELRSPLARARVASALLPDSRDRERIDSELAEMARLIDDLIESERLRTPHAALRRERLDLARLLAEELAPHALEARIVDERNERRPDARSDHRARQTVASGEALQDHDGSEDREDAAARTAEVPIVADAARLRLLIRNLVGNALVHGRGADGRADVTVTLARGDDTVRLEVADRGPGIDPALLEAVTEPFFRPDAARTRAAGGVGLGLSLARLVAEAHGGRLRVASDPAHEPGTRVSVLLPLGPPEGAAAEPAA